MGNTQPNLSFLLLTIGLVPLFVACVDYRIEDEDSTVLPPVSVVERFLQDTAPGVDVLFVVDGTGSMGEEQAAFAEAAAVFVEALDGARVSYQLGVVSTDPLESGVLRGLPWIITGAGEAPAASLASALDVGNGHVPPSAGLAVALSALADSSGQNQGFRRADAALELIFLSDDDDESDEVLGTDAIVAFLEKMAEEEARTGRPARASAVIGDVPGGCSGSGGTALPGERYAEVAAETGGEIVSICTTSFSDIATTLAETGVDWPRTFTLQAVPDAGSVVVEVDGARVTDGFEVDGDVVSFDTAPAPNSLIEIAYTLTASAS